MKHLGALLALFLLPCLTFAALDLQLNEAGGIAQITMGDKIVGENIILHVVKPGWSGDWATQVPGKITMLSDTGENPRSLVMEMDCEGGPIHLEQTIEQSDDAWRINWRLTPSQDLTTELVALMVALPVEGNAGQSHFYSSEGEAILARLLPAEKPEPYSITGGAAIDWCGWLLPGDTGLMMKTLGAGMGEMRLQDDRQFGQSAFGIHFPLHNSQSLKAGQTYEFGLELKPLTQAVLDQYQQKIFDIKKSLEVDMTSEKSLAIHEIKPDKIQVPVFEKIEFDLDLDAAYDNPFDPAQIDVMAEFKGPEGQILKVPGFFYQDYKQLRVEGKTLLTGQGDPVWKVRFAPSVPGQWTMTVTAQDKSGQVKAAPVSFEAVQGENNGFVRRSPHTPWYMQFDNGKPYYAIGENVCWPGQDTFGDFNKWFTALGAAGGNYSRIWLVRWNMGLEWMNGFGSGRYHGLGRYSMDNAWKLDKVMEMGRENGIYNMLTLGYHGEVMDTKGFFGEDCWRENPYNVDNGGPCETPADFWTNETARKFYQQRLRYYIARYGWDTNVLSWEFWNEVVAPEPWVREMAQYFSQNDPYHHLVTTTYGFDEVWRIPELDYTQAHTYGADEDRPTTVPTIASLGTEFTTRWEKPFMIGEFGIDFKTSDLQHDPKGLGTSLHEGIWASLMTRCFGVAAIWYWDGYVHPQNLYHEFTSIKKFTDTVPWNTYKPDLAKFTAPMRSVAADTPWQDIVVHPTLGWEKAPGLDVNISADGKESTAISRLLFSSAKPELKAPIRFRINYPVDGNVTFHVENVSTETLLAVRIDDLEVWRKQFPTGPEGEGEWEKSNFRELWGYESIYNKDYTVPVPAGEHLIEFEVIGGDWMGISSYRFSGCRDPQYATVDLLGLRADDLSLLWLHDQNSSWYNDKYGRLPQPLNGVNAQLLNMPDGKYRIDWWDTRKGEVISSETLEASDGKLAFTAPEFLRDIAGRIERLK